MNILDSIYNNKITSKEAEGIILEITEAFHGNKTSPHYNGNDSLQDAIGMDELEYTAYCQGASLHVVSKWRYEGWPNKDLDTGETVDYKKDNWVVKKKKNELYLSKL